MVYFNTIHLPLTIALMTMQQVSEIWLRKKPGERHHSNLTNMVNGRREKFRQQQLNLSRCAHATYFELPPLAGRTNELGISDFSDVFPFLSLSAVINNSCSEYPVGCYRSDCLASPSELSSSSRAVKQEVSEFWVFFVNCKQQPTYRALSGNSTAAARSWLTTFGEFLSIKELLSASLWPFRTLWLLRFGGIVAYQQVPTADCWDSEPPFLQSLGSIGYLPITTSLHIGLSLAESQLASLLALLPTFPWIASCQCGFFTVDCWVSAASWLLSLRSRQYLALSTSSCIGQSSLAALNFACPAILPSFSWLFWRTRCRISLVVHWFSGFSGCLAIAASSHRFSSLERIWHPSTSCRIGQSSSALDLASHPLLLPLFPCPCPFWIVDCWFLLAESWYCRSHLSHSVDLIRHPDLGSSSWTALICCSTLGLVLRHSPCGDQTDSTVDCWRSVGIVTRAITQEVPFQTRAFGYLILFPLLRLPLCSVPPVYCLLFHTPTSLPRDPGCCSFNTTQLGTLVLLSPSPTRLCCGRVLVSTPSI